jgi:diguanylate cyclase (GGDEF)-like protein
VLQSNLRPRDAVYRYGGEEFCLVLPGSDQREAAAIAERIREEIARRAVRLPDASALHVTASFGVAATVGGEVSGLVERADQALYEAKEQGRNRVIVAD